MSTGAARDRRGPRNGETADTRAEGPNPAARGLGVCGCAKEAAGSARMGLSPVLLLVLALAVSGWPAPVAAVSTFTGEGFDFMGQPGRYYSLINTPGVQVRLFGKFLAGTTAFQMLASGRCGWASARTQQCCA